MPSLRESVRRVAPGAYRRLRWLKRDVQLLHWRSRNLNRLVRYRLAPDRDGDDLGRALAEELRREGIVIRPSTEIFRADPGLFARVQAAAQRLWADGRASGQAQGPRGKEYKVSLLTPPLAGDDPFLQLALGGGVLSVAQRYLGLQPLLRTMDLWWDRPTTGPAKETQLWHRDGDDLLSVKAFVYLNDVEQDGGPFCFIPQTHPLGSRRLVVPACNGQGRSTEEQMAQVIPPSAWLTCTGATGTVILCDTGGYHKGLKPLRRDRLLLMWQYTSGTPRYPQRLSVVPAGAERLPALHRQVLAS